jgi:hypothetical protein
MILSGLGDDEETTDPTTTSDPFEEQEQAAWDSGKAAVAAEPSTVTVEGPASSITFYPATVSPAKTVPRPPGATSSLLDKIMPRKAGAGGVVKIWGMPPALAYALAAIFLGGVSWYAYRELAGGRRRVASNPRRRGKRRGKARRKRC